MNLKVTVGSATRLEGGVRVGVFSWLQSATSPLDVTKSYTLPL